MDDIGNIIYLIIILLSVVFSAFKKKKKPAAPQPQEKKQRPAFDPMQELETFLERFDEPKKDNQFENPETEIVEDEEILVGEANENTSNPYMQHLEDDRFREATPQTFSDEKLISDDIRDIAPGTARDNEELSTSNFFDQNTERIKNLRKKKNVLKKFNAKDAIIYSAIINRPYQ